MTMMMFKKCLSLVIMLSLIMILGSNGFAQKKATAGEDGKSTVMVNVNTAGIQELMKLPRIGEKMAQRIIEFREKNGKFKKIQDLMKVKGIGEKTFKKMEKMVTI